MDAQWLLGLIQTSEDRAMDVPRIVQKAAAARTARLNDARWHKRPNAYAVSMTVRCAVRCCALATAQVGGHAR